MWGARRRRISRRTIISRPPGASAADRGGAPRSRAGARRPEGSCPGRAGPRRRAPPRPGRGSETEAGTGSRGSGRQATRARRPWPYSSSAASTRGAGLTFDSPALRHPPAGAWTDGRTPNVSRVAELRLALLEERGDPLAEVRGLGGEDLVAVLHRDRLLEAAGVDRVLQALLGELQAERGVAEHPLRQVPGGGDELGVGDDAGHQADALRPRRVDEVARQQQLARDRRADHARQEV